MKHAWHYMDGVREKRRKRNDRIAFVIICAGIFAASLWGWLSIPGAL